MLYVLQLHLRQCNIVEIIVTRVKQPANYSLSSATKLDDLELSTSQCHC